MCISGAQGAQQAGAQDQTHTCWKAPMGVRMVCTTCPVPPQVLHCLGLVPFWMPLLSQALHSSSRVTSISLLCPRQQAVSQCAACWTRGCVLLTAA